MAVISFYRSIFSRINSMMAVIAGVGAGSWCITQRNSSGSGIQRIKEKGEASFIAVEAALLLEEGYQNDFDTMA